MQPFYFLALAAALLPRCRLFFVIPAGDLRLSSPDSPQNFVISTEGALLRRSGETCV
jgi:hypothetical protein